VPVASKNNFGVKEGISNKKNGRMRMPAVFFVVFTFPTLLQEPQALRAPQVLPEPPALPPGPEQVQVREPVQLSQPASALPPSCSQQLQTITS
jgi:hypothetical protein